jgi:capsular exopolysaccharide synthesis family protein
MLLDRGEQMIARIPADTVVEPSPQIDAHLVTLLGRPSPEVDQYNALRYALEEKRMSDGLHVVAITSPSVGDGKTTTSVNLAGALAHRRDARVLLIDADLRRPSVSPLLGLADLPGRLGFVDAISDGALTLERAVTHLPAFNLNVLPAGRLSDDPFELLRTPRVGELLQEARRRYDFVIVDTPPVLLVPDSRILESWVDGFLLVVSANRTRRRLVAEALNLLAPGKMVGLVFNRDDRPLSNGYGYGYEAYTSDRARTGASTKASRWR